MLLHSVITTEKVPFSYRVAGMGARFLAWLVDSGIIVVLGFVGVMAGNVLEIARPGLGQALITLWVFTLLWGYFLAFEWLWFGQTPGKRLVGIRVIRWQGTSVGLYEAAVRNVVRAVDALPFFYGLGFCIAAANRYHRRLGDLAAGTLVVHVERKTPPIRALHETTALAGELSASLIRQRLGQLSREQKQTILDVCLRRNQLRVSDRAQLFRSVADHFRAHLDLAPAEHQSDEKFVLQLTAVLGAELSAR